MLKCAVEVLTIRDGMIARKIEETGRQTQERIARSLQLMHLFQFLLLHPAPFISEQGGFEMMLPAVVLHLTAVSATVVIRALSSSEPVKLHPSAITSLSCSLLSYP